MDDQQGAIDSILDVARHVAVVGISDNPVRPSNEVASYLLRQDFKVSPVNPNLSRVLGQACYPDLRSVPGPVDVVDVFRRSTEAGLVVDEAIAIGARAVWLQEGVIDAAAAARARQAGLLVVMDRCILKEHARRAARGGRFA
ncbi:MAG: CoA-binding protein [Actinobacteria bacterium]|nr:CoA-binding protein [Actinomycetota bacterium]